MDYLIEALRGPALDFYGSLSAWQQEDYDTLVRKLEQRFHRPDSAFSSQKMLFSVRQREEEGLTQFASRVSNLACSAYPCVEENQLDAIALVPFLRGCRDKSAAVAASDHFPKTVDKAASLVQTLGENEEIFGEKKMRVRALRRLGTASRPYLASSDSDSEPTDVGQSTVRHLKEQTTGEKRGKLDVRLSRMDGEITSIRTEVTLLKGAVEELNQKLGKLLTRQSRSPDNRRNRSPSYRMSPDGNREYQCYRCHQWGHMARDCPSAPASDLETSGEEGN